MRSYAMSSNYPETAIVHKDPDQERSVVSRSTIHSLKGVENGGHARHYSRTSSGFLQRFSNEGAPDPDLTSYRTIPNEDDDFGFRSRFSSTQVSNQLLFWINFCTFRQKKSKTIENSQKYLELKGSNLVFYSQFGPRRAVSTVTAGTQAPSVIKESRFIPEQNLVRNFPDLEPHLATREVLRANGLSSVSRRSSDVISRRSSTYSIARR